MLLRRKLAAGIITAAEYEHLAPLGAVEDGAAERDAHFIIRFVSSKSVRLRAASENERARWIDVLMPGGQGSGAKHRPSTQRTPSVAIAPLHLVVADGAPSIGATTTTKEIEGGNSSDDLGGYAGCVIVRAGLLEEGLPWGAQLTARLEPGARVRAICYGGAVASFGRSELRALPHLAKHPLLRRAGEQTLLISGVCVCLF